MSVMVSKLSVLPNDPVSVLSSLSSSGILVLSSSWVSVLLIDPVSALSSSWVSVLPIDPVLALSSSGISVLSSSCGSREFAAISSLGASLGVGSSWSSWCSESVLRVPETGCGLV
jgi:hypothetical protein